MTVCAASRFRTLTDTSCSSGVQYSRAADFAGHGCGRAAAHLTDDQSDRAPVLHPDIPRTLAYYKKDKLDFGCRGTWQDPPVYAAIVALDQHAIHFCCAQPPKANPDKYADELLDAYFSLEDADVLYAEYAGKGVEFTRELVNTPWHTREFVVKDCDGRLLAFGSNL